MPNGPTTFMAEARDGIEAKSLLEQFVRVVEAEAAIRKRRLSQAGSLVSRFRIGEFGIVSGLKAQQLLDPSTLESCRTATPPPADT